MRERGGEEGEGEGEREGEISWSQRNNRTYRLIEVSRNHTFVLLLSSVLSDPFHFPHIKKTIPFTDPVHGIHARHLFIIIIITLLSSPSFPLPSLPLCRDSFTFTPPPRRYLDFISE